MKLRMNINVIYITICSLHNTSWEYGCPYNNYNFLDWYWIIRIAFKQERMLYVLENPIPLVLDEDVDNEVKNEYQCHIYYNLFPT
jgi:hypothetical protein